MENIKYPKNMSRDTVNKEGVDNDYYKPPINEVIQHDEVSAVEQVNKKDYGRSTELYNEKMLAKQWRQHFITIPQSSQIHAELFENLKKASVNIKYLCVAKEHHARGGDHYHIYIATTSQAIKIAQIHRRIMETKGDIDGSINYQQVKTANAVITYIKKDGNFLEFGTIPKRKNDPASAGSSADIDKLLIEIYNNEESLEDNIQQLKEKYPSYYTINYEAIIARLEAKENVAYKRWKPPEYNSTNTKLKPYQERIWELINTEPKTRQIIWVNGKPNSGKSFMFNYIDQNYDYGIYSAGSTASLDNAVYGYDGQGAICWDIPLNYNYADMGDALASTIEKFSDYGQTLTSRKYKGKKIQVRGHVIVFANRPILPQLTHRDIIRINTRDDETEEQKLATWNITKKLLPQGRTIWLEEQMLHGQMSERRIYHSKSDLPIEVLEDVYNQ
uniref:Replication-associated protein n=1 Tax=Pygoscelis antarcticus TaxID=79643 RepID=A0A7G7LKM5_PYGAN|nr:replication-associated protein [Pygoscelis antarcticus]